MKFKENKPFLVGITIGIIIIGGIAIYPIIVELSKPKTIEPKLYIATDDSYGSTDKIVNGNKTYIIGGSYYAGYIRFNLTNKPKIWNKVEFSLYKFEINGESNKFKGVAIELFEANWNESMTEYELNLAFCYRFWYVNLREILNISLGLQRIDITNYIRSNKTISVRLTGGIGDCGNIKIYSKEANTTIDKLPQLIWS